MIVPAAIERGPGIGASDTPGLSRSQECIVSGAAVQGSLVPLPDCLALIYQRLSLTPTGGSGDPRAPCQSASASSAAPPPIDPLGVGAPHPRPLRCLLQKHNLLTEGGHGPPPSPGREIAGGERSHPISTKRSRRSRAHAGQNSNVCCAESTLV